MKKEPTSERADFRTGLLLGAAVMLVAQACGCCAAWLLRWCSMQMKITGAHWTPQVNVLHITCACGMCFDHRADRWRVCCPWCGRCADLTELRGTFVPIVVTERGTT